MLLLLGSKDVHIDQDLRIKSDFGPYSLSLARARVLRRPLDMLEIPSRLR